MTDRMEKQKLAESEKDETIELNGQWQTERLAVTDTNEIGRQTE